MQRVIHILVAEDSDEEMGLISKALSKVIPFGRIQRVSDARQAIAYLSGDDGYGDRARHPLPNVILSDLKMPNGDGFMLLSWVRAHPQFSKLPFIMMSGLAKWEDSRDAIEKGANAFVDKEHLGSDPLRFASRILYLIEHP